MTLDFDAIKAALAANAEGDCAQAETAYNTLVANAPVWLASLCDEIERLRANAQGVIDSVVAERDAALATVEHRNSELAVTRDEIAALKHAHQDVADALVAALAELERVKATS